MADSVIIFVADDNYVDHVKSIAVNCVRHGLWRGDFAAVVPRNSVAAAEFKRHKFHTLEVEESGFLAKFRVFDPFFKQWERALYLDCDVLIQDDLERLFTLLNEGGDFWMDTEDGDTLRTFFRDPNPEANKEIYDYMKREYPFIVDKLTFNSAFMLFRPASIADDTPQRLVDIQKRIEPVNRQEDGGTDQQVINLLLWPQIKKIPRKLACFWGLAEPENDGPSEFRGFVGGEVPVAIHYSRWYAPWIVKPPGTGAHMIRKLGVPCHDLYRENLEAFATVFPAVT